MKMMKRIFRVTSILIIIMFLSSCNKGLILQNGDIIFQISKSRQSNAIQKATNSKYSHMGIIYIIDGDEFVYEAIQPVKITPIKKWINRGVNKHYVVKRLKDWKTLLTNKNLSKMKKIGEQYKGKSYDIYFEWSDERIYCSELVWKIYKNSIGVEIGDLKMLKSFNLSDPIVKKMMFERYKDKIPYNEKVISPKDMFDSDKLFTVISN